ncbi:MAG: hypothetical protein EPO32_09145 [Anaerolineae bacterium]|nr:MAG: hypothetical protein EPO32_09145 [Anaerolineae bacterium]
MTAEQPALVTCYSGHTYAQRPRAVQWQGLWQDILAITADWHTPEGRTFRVLTANGHRLELHYRAADDCWAAAST